jgi:hypothetical protein
MSEQPNISFSANGADWQLTEDGAWKQVNFATAYVSAFITTKGNSVFIRGFIQDIDEHHFKVMPTADFRSEAFGFIFDKRTITHLSVYPVKE